MPCGTLVSEVVQVTRTVVSSTIRHTKLCSIELEVILVVVCGIFYFKRTAGTRVLSCASPCRGPVLRRNALEVQPPVRSRASYWQSNASCVCSFDDLRKKKTTASILGRWRTGLSVAAARRWQKRQQGKKEGIRGSSTRRRMRCVTRIKRFRIVVGEYVKGVGV